MKRWLPFCAVVLVCSPGCLIIEKKTMVLAVPPDSKEVRMYYVFEGLSVCAGGDRPLDRARRGLTGLKKPGLSFFIQPPEEAPPSPTKEDDPVLKHFRFQDLRFFLDPSRKRQLC